MFNSFAPCDRRGKYKQNNMNHKISFEQLNNPKFRRAQQMKIKSEATWAAFLELNGIINITKFTRTYFGKSQSWFAQKLAGMNVCNKTRTFTETEYTTITNGLRDLAKRLNDYADAIDKANLG